MKKTFLTQYEQGSAEHVLAHAAWQRSRGRNPSMSFLGEHNPRKALLLAESVFNTALHAKLIDLIGAIFGQHKPYHNMTDYVIGDRKAHHHFFLFRG